LKEKKKALETIRNNEETSQTKKKEHTLTAEPEEPNGPKRKKRREC
jgi:hypothetical protein